LRQTPNTGGVYFGLLAGSLFWGTSFAAAKIGLRELSPLNLVIARFGLASVLFAVILGFGRERPKLHRHDVPRFLLLGFLVIASYFYIQFVALRYTTTIASSLIIACSPVFTALISQALGRERLRAMTLTGIAIAFLGVMLIITNGRWSSLLQSNSWKGDCLLLLNALVWSGFTIYGQTLVQTYRPFVAIAFIQIAGTLPLLPFVFFATRLDPVPLCIQIRHITWPTYLAVLLLAAPCSVFAYQMWYKAVEALGPVRTSVFLYLNPLFAIAAAIIVLHEPLTAFTLFGGGMIILGVYATNVGRQQIQGAKSEPVVATSMVADVHITAP
jgi:drug/metabolite transporter (DMT)-like permease